MGKTKWYAASENNSQEPQIRLKSTANARQRASAPGRFFQPPPEELPLRLLLRQIWWRFRRHWIALCFQANRYTGGIFRRQTALKLGILTVAGYMLLFSDQEYWIFSGNPVSTLSDGAPVETSLDIPQEEEYAERPKKRKSVNDAAPLDVSELSSDQSVAYIQRFSKIAITEMKKYGIPASISLAQGLVESRYGTSTLARRNNNHFGIKCFSKNCKRGHCSNFSDDHHKDFFRSFTNPWESWRAHSQMLASGRYTRLKKHGRDYRKWAHGLQQLGYATDRSYAQKLIGVIERYDLHRFDR